MKYCSRCVTPDTRPRLTFDADGVCSACQWHDKKQTSIAWNVQLDTLGTLCDQHRRIDGRFDIIVPCSGGKDGSYVANIMKHIFHMNPLCITFAPQIQTRIGRINLENFKQSGYSHLTVQPNSDIYKAYSKRSFVDRGMPKQPFVTGISTSILRLAELFDINFVMYGEQGELEYGGNANYIEKFNREFLLQVYYEGEDPSKYGYWWQLPSQKSLDNITATWYSLYEDWDPQRHALEAKEKFNLVMTVGGSIGTFTNYAQLDDVMQDLHAYMMFLKFGFGRCTSDASIEIRRGRMTREEGVKVVKVLDGIFPLEYLDYYLEYFDMSKPDFYAVLDKHANKALLTKTNLDNRPYVLNDVVSQRL